MAAMPKEERLTLDEAAAILGFSPGSVVRWANELGLGRRRLGKLTFNTGDLQRLAARAEWERTRAKTDAARAEEYRLLFERTNRQR